jgi:hypothetical protein
MWSGTGLMVVVLVIVLLWAVPIAGTLALFPATPRIRCHRRASDHD